MRRKASVISDCSSELYGLDFVCVACKQENPGCAAVRISGSMMCLPCARAVFRRLLREMVKGTRIGQKLQRVGQIRIFKAMDGKDFVNHHYAQYVEGKLKDVGAR